MFQEIKKQARGIVRNNYRQFFFPVLLYIFADGAATFSWQFFLERMNTDVLWKHALLAVFLLLRLAVLPLLLFWLVHVSVRLTSKSQALPFGLRDAAKLITIALVPNVVKVLCTVADDLTDTQHLSAFVGETVVALLALLFVASLYVDFKFFACNYHYALHKGTVKETVDYSFKGMCGKFPTFLLLMLSFVLWDIVAAVLAVALFSPLNLNMFWKSMLQSTGCGVYFYLLPYRYVTYTLFVKNNVKKRRV